MYSWGGFSDKSMSQTVMDTIPHLQVTGCELWGHVTSSLQTQNVFCTSILLTVGSQWMRFKRIATYVPHITQWKYLQINNCTVSKFEICHFYFVIYHHEMQLVKVGRKSYMFSHSIPDSTVRDWRTLKAFISRTRLEDHLLLILLSVQLITSIARGLSRTEGGGRKIWTAFSLQLGHLLTDSVRGPTGIDVLIKLGVITS